MIEDVRQPADAEQGRATAAVAASRVAYLFTTFPVPSETFLRREVQAMRHLGVDVRAWSLWGGADGVDGLPVRRVRRRRALELLWRLPSALLRTPEAFSILIAEMLDEPPPSLLNIGENLWGVAAAILVEADLRAANPERIHAVWASMPATAAWLLSRLTGIPFTLGAHAYDVFEHGGDWLLPLKLRDAALVHTTTDAARTRLLARACPPERLLLVRRGLTDFPPFKPLRAGRTPLRLVAVGRLVEKKGYPALLALCSRLRRRGIRFELHIAGGGPLEAHLRSELRRLDLAAQVRIEGAVDTAAVMALLAWADVFVFTGRVAESGDRDGFPNAVGEAMAAGLPVLATPVGGIPEVIRHGEMGLVLPLDAGNPRQLDHWCDALALLQVDDTLCDRLRRAARQWTEAEFDARKNAARLLEAACAVNEAPQLRYYR